MASRTPDLALNDHKPPWADMYQQSRSAAKQFVNNVVDVQSHWAHQYIDMMIANYQPSAPAHWRQDLNRLVDEWAGAERKLCEAWLPATPWQPPFVDTSTAADAMNSVWRAWISTGQEALIIQSALTSKMVTGSPAAKSDKT